MVWGGKYVGIWSSRHKETGAHPGVDIGGEVGDNIYSIATGEVVVSECNTSGWGGDWLLLNMTIKILITISLITTIQFMRI